MKYLTLRAHQPHGSKGVNSLYFVDLSEFKKVPGNFSYSVQLSQTNITVPFSHSRSIWILCYDLRVLCPAKSTIKTLTTPLKFWLLTGIDLKLKCSKSQSSSLISFKTMDSESWHSKKLLDLLGSKLRILPLHTVNRCSPGGPDSIPGHCKL